MENTKTIESLKCEHDTITRYLNSKEFAKLQVYFNKKAGVNELELFRILTERTKTETTKSELDKTYSFYNLMQEFIDKIGNTEDELYLKNLLIEEKQNILTHILNKTDEGYDLPLYTELDLVRQKRIDYLCIDQRFKRIRAQIGVEIDQLEKNLKSDSEG